METKQVVRNESQSSVSVEKNSRGVTFCVKIYADSPDEAEEKLNRWLSLAKKKSNELLEEL